MINTINHTIKDGNGTITITTISITFVRWEMT